MSQARRSQSRRGRPSRSEASAERKPRRHQRGCNNDPPSRNLNNLLHKIWVDMKMVPWKRLVLLVITSSMRNASRNGESRVEGHAQCVARVYLSRESRTRPRRHHHHHRYRTSSSSIGLPKFPSAQSLMRPCSGLAQVWRMPCYDLSSPPTF